MIASTATLNLEDARILIVDDQIVNVELLGFILRGDGFTNIVSVCDPRDAVDTYLRELPDLILLDLHMPHLDGVEVMERLAPIIAGDFVPILVLTGDTTSDAKQRALSMGAKDFLTKPFSRTEALLRIRNLLETRMLYRQLREHNATLEIAVQERTRELEETQLEILERLAIAAEFRDDSTGQHARRVGDLAALISNELCLNEEDVELIRRAALLHDVGKIGIPDHILLKRSRFTSQERAQMAAHTEIGGRIVGRSRSRLLQMAEQIATSHHERWDVNGKAIPLAGRIVAVADVFDALTHERSYKAAWPARDAIAEIVRQRGGQFDPEVVDAFLRVERCQLPKYALLENCAA